MMAREIYDKYFREAQATPRGVVAKLRNIMYQLEAACIKHQAQIKVGFTYGTRHQFDLVITA